VASNRQKFKEFRHRDWLTSANSRGCRAYFCSSDMAHRDRTGWLTRQSRSNQSLHQNSLLTGKLTGNFAVLGVVLQIWHPINAKLQSVAVKFPKQKNREFFEASREITKLNRDQPAAVRHHVRNSLWPSTLTRFSLEGEELGSNILFFCRPLTRPKERSWRPTRYLKSRLERRLDTFLAIDVTHKRGGSFRSYSHKAQQDSNPTASCTVLREAVRLSQRNSSEVTLLARASTLAGDLEATRLGGLEVDEQIEFRQQHYRQIVQLGWRLPLILDAHSKRALEALSCVDYVLGNLAPDNSVLRCVPHLELAASNCRGGDNEVVEASHELAQQACLMWR
jgi:hypothetical protein